MFEVGDGTIAYGGKDVVFCLGCAHGLKQWFISQCVAGGAHQGRHGTACAGAVNHYTVGVAGHHTVEQAQIAHGCFQVKQAFRGTSGIDAVLHGVTST